MVVVSQRLEQNLAYRPTFPKKRTKMRDLIGRFKRILGAQLRSLREARGMRLRELSSLSGISESVLSRLERGLTFPRRTTLEAIASALGIEVIPLLESIANQLGIDPAPLLIRLGYASKREVIPPLPRGGRLLKVIAEVPCGKPYEALEELLGYIIIHEDEFPGATFSLRAIGDSMSPLIMHGDFIIVRQQDDVESGSIAVVSLETEGGFETTVKKVIKQDTEIILESLNPSYPPIVVNIKEKGLRIIGEVIGLKRYFK
jgi:repressor LexA